MDGDQNRLIELDLSASAHVAAYAYWRARKPGIALLPSRRDLDPVEMPRTLLPWLNLIEVHRIDGTTRYRHRLVGTGIVDMRDRDGTGFWFDELYDPARLQRVCRILDEIVQDGHPRVIEDNLANTGKAHRTMHSLVLPLATDGQEVDMPMAVAYYD